MKRLLLILSFTVLATKINCQQAPRIYYDKNWKITDSTHYEYYRTVIEYKNIFQVTDYYKSGQIQMTGTYKSSQFNDPTGQFMYYRRNGRFVQHRIYDPLKYPTLLTAYLEYLEMLAPIPDSAVIYATFWNNGKIFTLGYTLDSCDCLGSWIQFTPKGDLEHLKTYKYNTRHGPYIRYWDNKKVVTGQYEYGKRSGEWIFYDRKGYPERRAYYKSGKRIHRMTENQGF